MSKPRNQMIRGKTYVRSFAQKVASDPRFTNIIFHSVSWSGIGHEPYIPVGGFVKSQLDWEAFTNLVYESGSPIRVTIKTITIKPEDGEERPPTI